MRAVVIAMAAVGVSSCGDPCEQLREPIEAFAPFANRAVPRNVELRVIGDAFDATTAVLIDPAGTSTTLPWEVDAYGWILVPPDLNTGVHRLDLYGDGREVIPFRVDNVVDNRAPTRPGISTEWTTTSNGADDVVLCDRPFESSVVAVSIESVPPDVAWMRVNGQARAVETEFVETNTLGSIRMVFVDLAGNVSDESANDDGVYKGDCASTPPGVGLFGLVLLARRRRGPR